MPHQLSEAASTYVSSGLLASCKTVLYLTQAAVLVSREMVLEEKKGKENRVVERRGKSGRGKQRKRERERVEGVRPKSERKGKHQ